MAASALSFPENKLETESYFSLSVQPGKVSITVRVRELLLDLCGWFCMLEECVSVSVEVLGFCEEGCW